jgi:hypothetical protein
MVLATKQPSVTTPRRIDRKVKETSAADLQKRRLGRMYVYLTTGEVIEVESIEGVSLTQESLQLHREGSSVVEYPRSSVYFISRDLISPPVLI